MKFTLEPSSGIYTLHSYLDHTLSIRPPNAQLNDEESLLQLQRSCIISAQQLIQEWPPQQLAELTAEDLKEISAMQPEVLIIGSGDTMRFPATEQLAMLVKLGIGYEVMDTAAACRTYNVLVSEGRNVVAALFTG